MAYIDRLQDEDASAALVAIADKLHNARTMLADYRVIGDDLWCRFSAGPDDQIWYLKSVAEAVDGRVPPALLAELADIIRQLQGHHAER